MMRPRTVLLRHGRRDTVNSLMGLFFYFCPTDEVGRIELGEFFLFPQSKI